MRVRCHAHKIGTGHGDNDALPRLLRSTRNEMHPAAIRDDVPGVLPYRAPNTRGGATVVRDDPVRHRSARTKARCRPAARSRPARGAIVSINNNDNTVSKYDRVRGGLEGVALFTKPSTVKNTQIITGKSETFVIETARHAELGDTIFVECMDDAGVTRLALPPKVANAIASQRESLTSRRRSILSKENARARKERGELPGFMSNPGRGGRKKKK